MTQPSPDATPAGPLSPSWADLQVFLVLSRRLHFGRTAAALGISQAQVSRRIKTLEHTVGVPLLSRTTRTVELTADGERLRASLERVESVLKALIAETGVKG